MSWTQPICDECYSTESPGRDPVRLKEPDIERCCVCGTITSSGIYVRRDPRMVPFPRKDPDDPA